MMIEDTEVFGW